MVAAIRHFMLETAPPAESLKLLPAAQQKRAVKILAKSIYRELREQGYDEKQIVALATELLGEVASRMAQTPTAQS